MKINIDLPMQMPSAQIDNEKVIKEEMIIDESSKQESGIVSELQDDEELKEAIEVLIRDGRPIDKKTVQVLKAFMQSAKGDIKEKLDTLTKLIKKGLDINLKNLSAIHEALHGRNLDEVFSEIITKLNLNIENNKGSFINNFDTKKTLKLNNQRDYNNIEKLAFEIETEKFVNSDSDSQELGINNEENDFKDNQEAILADMTDCNNDEQSAQIQSITNEISTFLVQNDNTNKLSKDYIVSEVTNKLAKLTDEFRTFRKDFVRQLDYSIQNKTISIESISDTIDALDKLILKSEILDFSDMKMEKELIKSSSELNIAREYLSLGKIEEARSIISNVKNAIGKMDFKPSIVKTIHTIKTDMGFDFKYDALPKKLLSCIDKAIIKADNNISIKDIQKSIKSLGINFETELFDELSKNEIEICEKIFDNLKSMTKTICDSKDTSINQSTKAALMQLSDNISGQQLLSKNNTEGTEQTLVFNLPLSIAGETQNVKVFVNGRQDRQKIDWQNCSVYFQMETKRLGETGILISSSNRNISLTIKNDSVNINSYVNEHIDKMKESLSEIGYNIGRVNFTEFTKEDKAVNQENKKVQPKVFSSGGFDIKI